jgi:hypothetical protein
LESPGIPGRFNGSATLTVKFTWDVPGDPANPGAFDTSQLIGFAGDPVLPDNPLVSGFLVPAGSIISLEKTLKTLW